MTELTDRQRRAAEPSSTRLLADRLAASATKHLAEQGFSVNTRVVELRPLARSIADAMTRASPTPSSRRRSRRSPRPTGWSR